MNSRNITFDLIASILLFLLTIIVVYIKAGENFNFTIHLLFLTVIFESIVLMTLLKSPLLKMYYVFSYLFFGLIPYLEHSERIYSYWGLPPVRDDTLVLVNTLLILLNVVVFLSYRFSSRRSYSCQQYYFKKDQLLILMKDGLNNKNYQDRFFSLLIISAFATLINLYINDFNILNLLFRGASYNKVSLNSSLSLFINYFVKPLPAIILIFYILYKPKNYKLKCLIFFPLCFINVFPTAVPRFYAAAIYIPILIILWKGLLIKNRLNYFIIGSIFLIFPLLDNFRRISEDNLFSIEYNLDFLFKGHFDSYLSIGEVIQFDFVTHGYQLLGNLLFFVPRSLWSSKPEGTGYTFVKDFNLDFANVSANYYAEGFANFGYLGMFIFALALGMIIRRLDEKLLFKLINNKGPESIIPIYLVSLGFLFFILRGDLLSSISFFTGFFCSIKFCGVFFKKAYKQPL